MFMIFQLLEFNSIGILFIKTVLGFRLHIFSKRLLVIVVDIFDAQRMILSAVKGTFVSWVKRTCLILVSCFHSFPEY